MIVYCHFYINIFNSAKYWNNYQMHIKYTKIMHIIHWIYLWIRLLNLQGVQVDNFTICIYWTGNESLWNRKRNRNSTNDTMEDRCIFLGLYLYKEKMKIINTHFDYRLCKGILRIASLCLTWGKFHLHGNINSSLELTWFWWTGSYLHLVYASRHGP